MPARDVAPLGGPIGAYGVTMAFLAGAITGVTASAIGFGNVFWVCAALCAVATGLLAARLLPLGGGHEKPAGAA